ncbi:MAG: ferritin-like domain-containing protein [Bacteroidota bacterium]
MTLTWQELVQTAVALEEQGRDFYRHLAERAREMEARHVFTQLAAEEEEHAAFFRRWLPAGGQAVGEDTASYLRALRRPELFVGDEEALGDPRRALAVAIEAEKEAILYYTELAALVRDEQAREHLARLLKAEKLHLIEVRDRLEEGW